MPERASLIWVSGTPSPVPAEEAVLPALDRAFTQGEGLYETVRTYHSKPFAFGAHLQRLLRGAQLWGFHPWDTGDLEVAVENLCRMRAPEETALRITLSRGPAFPWSPEEAPGPPSWTVFAGPLPPYVAACYERGVRCILASRVRWNPGGFVPAIKFTANPDIALAKREARSSGAFEAILLNSAGLVAEGASSNLFLVRGRRLVTPSLSTGILDGVTRAMVIELAKNHGIPVEERDVAPWELLQAEEAFLTATLKEVIPVVEISGTLLGTGEPGRITDHLLGAYQERCLEECAPLTHLEETGG